MRVPEEWLSTTEPGLTASFTFFPGLCALSLDDDVPIRRNCLIFKHNYLMRYFQYAQYPIVLIDLLPQEKTVKIEVNKLL